MSLRDNLRKAAGLFIEIPRDDDAMVSDVTPDDTATSTTPAPVSTVGNIVRQAEGPNLDEISVPAAATAAVDVADGNLKFVDLYQQAGFPTVPFTAEQMLDMLASLPTDVPLDSKRQMVKATLNAMGKAIGATPENIVTDASRKLAALTSYVEAVSKKTAEFNSTTELEIAALQAQIGEKRKAIEAGKQRQALIAKCCETEANRLDDVLEFFSLDVPPSKYAGTSDGVKR
ncbi:MAG TPA: hypothetical protein VGM23_06620 [Armatimonadota bacterium]|jgi:hypothetical protein